MKSKLNVKESLLAGLIAGITAAVINGILFFIFHRANVISDSIYPAAQSANDDSAGNYGIHRSGASCQPCFFPVGKIYQKWFPNFCHRVACSHVAFTVQSVRCYTRRYNRLCAGALRNAHCSAAVIVIFHQQSHTGKAHKTG